MALAPGTRLGVYEVIAHIGEGGMGEVYRATDTRLKRQVAIKILPSSLAADPDRLARFQREAEVLASLNHPNIAHIHGLEEGAGSTALIMELVEGEDLSQRIVRGAIPIEEALPIAKQIAEALDAAFYRIGNKMMAVDITSRPGFAAGSPRLLFEAPLSTYGDNLMSYDVAPDGRFLGIRDITPDPPANQVTVVLNWFEELKRLVPAK